MVPIRLALIGLGKIAHDQHLPAIAADPAFTLVATASPDDPGLAGIPHYQSLEAMIEAGQAVDAVVLCTPPQVRGVLAAQAIAHGLHVFLEKPPGASLAEVAALDEQATDRNVTLFAAWHSRFAAGVEPARAWLAGRRIDSVDISWREDVRVWHPGQAWIWEPGGIGVFDPGINALSIATWILPNALFVEQATLAFPANRAAPIAASLLLRDTCGAPVTIDFDWRETGPQVWYIAVETDAGRCRIDRGGAMVELPEGKIVDTDREYAALYARFAALIRAGESEVDVRPFRLVADAFLLGRRETVEPFDG